MTRTLAAAVVLLAGAACTGGGEPSAVTPTSGPPRAAPLSSQPPAPPAPGESPVSKHGSAHVTYRGQQYTWGERGCGTTRRLDGRAAGFLATFQDTAEQQRRYVVGTTGSVRFVQLRLRGGYTGDGTYTGDRLSVRLVGAATGSGVTAGFGTRGQTLVLRDGGREGTYRGQGLVVEFTCDPTDDTSTEPTAALAAKPEKGSGYVVFGDGSAFRYEPVVCHRGAGATSIMVGEFPHFVRIDSARATGSVSVPVLLGLHGIGDRLAARVTLSGDPVTSVTFRHAAGGAGVTRGVFTC